MNAEEAELWRQLAVNLTRCEHGRVQGDTCVMCPDGFSPDQSNRPLGYSLDGASRLVIPPRELMSDPHNWYLRLVP